MTDISHFFGAPISTYTRAEAIADGVLADVSSLAREAGFRFPVALTSGVVSLIENAARGAGKDFTGITWDILNMLRFSIQRNPDSSLILFRVLIWSPPAGTDRPLTLKSICGPGDDMEPVITILLSSED